MQEICTNGEGKQMQAKKKEKRRLNREYKYMYIKENTMREKLKKARQEAGLTQQQIADKLDIGLRQYQRIEKGTTDSTFDVWDKLEDIFSIHQRTLREN